MKYQNSIKNKVVINGIPLLSPLTGIGNYTLNLSKAFLSLDQKSEFTFFYGYYSKELRTFNNSAIIRRLYKVKEFLKKNSIISAGIRNCKDMSASLKQEEFSLYFESNFIPTNIRARKVVTAVSDLSLKKFPHYHPRDRVEYFDKNFDKGLKRSDRLIVLSSMIKNELVGLMGVKKDKITVIPPGIDKGIFKFYPKREMENMKKKYHLPKKFIFYLGTIEPRKNLKGLIDAYLQLNIKKEFKLVIVGASGWKNKDVMQSFSNHVDDVLFLGNLPNIDIALMMNMASCLVYPSFYEGFGLPPLEAMACGCPAVVSNLPSIQEACGDAAYYIDPYNVDNITESIYSVLTNKELSQSLVKKGLERTRDFRWEKSARAHLKVFEEVLNS
ncbi:MAG: glycosyltransferase family 4 protein [Candidatus Scalindua sp.]|nr:glycosyltransferase family 4 protein [Candidatus Scalindua sp.]